MGVAHPVRTTRAGRAASVPTPPVGDFVVRSFGRPPSCARLPVPAMPGGAVWSLVFPGQAIHSA